MDIDKKYALQVKRRHAAQKRCEQLISQNMKLKSEHENSYAKAKKLIEQLEQMKSEWGKCISDLHDQQQKYKELNKAIRGTIQEVKKKISR